MAWEENQGTPYLFILFWLLPAFFGFNFRFKSTSGWSKNHGTQSGRPVRSCFRMSLISSSVTWELKKFAYFFFTNRSIGLTVTSRSSFPEICAAALLHLHPFACADNLARTGLFSTYPTHARRYLLSITYEAKRPCHRWPRQPCRKLIIRVYRKMRFSNGKVRTVFFLRAHEQDGRGWAFIVSPDTVKKY